MGLDLALAGLVLIVAIRGWLKGFLVQAIRLCGLVASVYVAAPLRDQVRPYVGPQLPSMRPELLDRLLWWALAVGSYFVIVGVASLVVAVSRRQSFGVSEPNRGDQFAGFGLGVLKGLVMASFVVAGLHTYAAPHIARIDWAEQQRKDSFSWQWNEQYHPAARIWAAPPVRNFVNHVHKMGLMGLPKPDRSDKSESPADPPVQTASRVPKLALPNLPPRTTRAHRPKLDRRPLVLKRPNDGRPGAGRSVPAPVSVPEVDMTGIDPDMARTVESILGQLQGAGATDN